MERATSDINVILQFLIVLIFISFLFVLFGKGTENGTKKPSAKPGIRMPRVKVLNYLKKVALLLLNLTLSKSVTTRPLGFAALYGKQESAYELDSALAVPYYLSHKSVSRFILAAKVQKVSERNKTIAILMTKSTAYIISIKESAI